MGIPCDAAPADCAVCRKAIVFLTPLHRLARRSHSSGRKAVPARAAGGLCGRADALRALLCAAGAGSVRPKRHSAQCAGNPAAFLSGWAASQRRRPCADRSAALRLFKSPVIKKCRRPAFVRRLFFHAHTRIRAACIFIQTARTQEGTRGRLLKNIFLEGLPPKNQRGLTCNPDNCRHPDENHAIFALYSRSGVFWRAAGLLQINRFHLKSV